LACSETVPCKMEYRQRENTVQLNPAKHKGVGSIR